ncbi:MAG: metallophosphoesterase family protein [Thermoleophilia bacterium]
MVRSARSLRVGLIADTHVGEFLPEMPAWVGNALEGCDLILHAGDLSRVEALDTLDAIAPVVAVRGDHDVGCDHLPKKAVVRLAGWSVGLLHGMRGKPIDTTIVLRQAAFGQYDWHSGLHRQLARAFGPVDAVVYGHWHVPIVERQGAMLMVSPGAVCPWGSLEGGAPPRPGRAGVADRVVRRFRDTMAPEVMEPTVAVMRVGSSGLRVQHIRVSEAA